VRIAALLLTLAAIATDPRGQQRSAARDAAASQRKPPPAQRPQRSTAARRAFQAGHPCPANGHTSGACPGYVIDHVIALKRGGPDKPSNMQWQTLAAARAKDRIE
jgi:hypothetical protein